jgi:hypothetical protein
VAIQLSDLMAWRDSLVQSRLQGISRVRDLDGSEIVYKDDAQMAAAIASANDLIAQMQTTQILNTIRFHTSKGLRRDAQFRTDW